MPRPAPLLLLLLCAACGGPEYAGKDVEAWTAELLDEAKTEAAIAALEDPAAVPVLAAILRGGEAEARLKAAAVVLRLGPRAGEAVPALIRALRAEDEGTRGLAALALGRIGEGARGSLVALDRALRDPSERVRVAAALAIYGISGDLQTAQDELFGGLSSRDPRVRGMVAEGLGQLGAAGVDLLILALVDASPGVREAAATTLGGLGPDARAARPTLEQLLLDDEPAVRAAAFDALKKIG